MDEYRWLGCALTPSVWFIRINVSQNRRIKDRMMKRYPFIYVSGSGYGVSQSSLCRNGPFNQCRFVGQAKVQLYVNVANGNVIIEDHPFEAEEMNGRFELRFIYNSQKIETPWRLNISSISDVDAENGLLTFIEADGHKTIYHYDKTRQA